MTSADALLEALKPVVAGLAETFGRSAEFVLHDYRNPDASVVAVAGNLTGRRPGDAMSKIGLRMLSAGAAATNEVNYRARTDDGRTVKCSTLPLHDADGALVGALCVNVDVTALAQARDVLADLAGEPTPPAEPVSFSGDVGGLIESVVDAEEARTGRAVTALDRRSRLEVVRSLRAAGVFALRGAPSRVADRLGISRAALYADLSATNEREAS